MGVLRWCNRAVTRRVAECLSAISPRPTRASLLIALNLAMCGGVAVGQTKPATTTVLAAIPTAGPSGSLASGTVVTLTATVKPAAGTIKAGQVNFCDAAYPKCTDIHLLGMSQLTAGKAVLRLRPAIGSHTYKAIFVGTKTAAASTSTTLTVKVTGTAVPLAISTTIAETGSWGKYALTATATEYGSTIAPTGSVSFVDTSNKSSILSTVSLGASVAGLGWPNPISLTTMSGGRGIAVGDLNEDGIPDLISISSGTYQPLQIFLGNANGTYAAGASPAVSAFTIGPVVIADFNGDGHQDMAIVDGDNSRLLILLGKGDGTFNVLSTSPSTGSLANQLAVGDFNGDGVPDLALTSDSTNSVGIFLGKGDGTFTGASTIPVVGTNPYSMAVGDFNGDGNLDLAVTDLNDDAVSVFLGKGDGTFAAAATLHCGSSGSPVVAADFNGDGKLDLAVGISGVNGGSDSVILLTGNGDGTFSAPSSGQVVNSNQISAVQVGDLNADGIPDLVLTESNSGIAMVFLGNGAGSFVPTSFIAEPLPNSGSLLAIGDMFGDGRSDLVVLANRYDAILIYRTEPTETASGTAHVTVANAGQHLVDASYSGDTNYLSSVSGKIPLWGVPPATSTTLTVTSGGVPVTTVVPGTALTLTASVKAGTTPVTAGQVKFCDASSASCADIHLLATAQLTPAGVAAVRLRPGPGQHYFKAVFSESSGGISSGSSVVVVTVGPAHAPVYTDATTLAVNGLPGAYSLTASVAGLGGSAPPTGNVSFIDTSFSNSVLAKVKLGTATAGVGLSLSLMQSLPNSLISQVSGDFNGDGIPDLAILSSTLVSGFYQGSVTVFLGKGNGTFTTGPTTVAVVPGQTYTYMVAGDFNADGKTDLVLLDDGSIYPDTVTTFLGKGDGSFKVSASSLVFTQSSMGGDFISGSMAVADFNGDGKLDLAVVGNYVFPGGITILLGNGDGTYKAAGPNFQTDNGFGLVAAGDFNGDGIPDLVAAEFANPSNATVFLGKGDGTFTPAATLTVNNFPASIVVGDFNADGKIDLAIGVDSSVAVFLGAGDGTFNQSAGSPFAGGGLSLIVGDFNHDGKADLAGIDNYASRINILYGEGNGVFTAPSVPAVMGQTLSSPLTIVAADFNEDGLPDLAMLTRYSNSGSILLSEPAETVSVTVNGIAPIGAGTHNVEASYSGDANYAPSVSATAPLTAALAPVIITPAPGIYTSVQTITLRESIPGATIYYSAWGPLSTNGFVSYTGPIKLSSAGTEFIQAYASETGYQSSPNQQVTYTLALPPATAPIISLASGRYAGTQTVSLSDSMNGASIYYTTNGTFPSVNSNPYTGPITVSSTETLVAAAVAYGYSLSPPATAQYFIGSSATSLIYTIAGTSTYGYTGNLGPATFAEFDYPVGVVKDSLGNVYVSDQGNHMVRRIAAGSGIVARLAGTGTNGFSGDGGPASKAELSGPSTLLIDSQDNLFIADSGNGIVRKMNLTTGIITTVAGSPTATVQGDGGPATAAQLGYIGGIALDASRNLYISETNNGVIRKVNGATGIITTAAGNGGFYYAGDGGPAIKASLGLIYGLGFDGRGNLFIADYGNDLILKIAATNGAITPNSIINIYAGKAPSASGYPVPGYGGDGGPATSALLNSPISVALDGSGNLYISDYYNNVIRLVTASTGIITTAVGDGWACGSFSGDGDNAASASLCFPRDVVLDSSNDLYIADGGGNRIRTVFPPRTPPSTQAAAPTFSVAGGTYASPQVVTLSDTTPGAAIYVSVDGSMPTTALSPGYCFPIDVAGNLTIKAVAAAPGYLVSAPASATYTITLSSPAITTVAGSGASGFSGAGGPALNVRLGFPLGVVVDKAGDIFVSDSQSNVVWEFSASTGRASIFAGTGALGYTGDGGLATNARLSGPQGIVLDSAGNLYIADTNNNVIRKVATTGIISTVAGGVYGSVGNIGDGGPATSASLSSPATVAFDGAGNLYIADADHYAIREVSAKTGIITTVAGNGKDSLSGDGGPATQAGIQAPVMLAVDQAGNIYLASNGSASVRKVNGATGVITTVAGLGDILGNTGDGGPATGAEIYPKSLSVDSAGNLYISSWPAEIRKMDPNTGIITKVAGIGFWGFDGDGGSALDAELLGPIGMAFDSAGDLIFADTYNYRIRKVRLSGLVAAPPVSSIAPGTYSKAQSVSITDTTYGSVIHFTTNGTTPTTASATYSTAITVSSTETIKAIAAAPGSMNSAVASATYTIK